MLDRDRLSNCLLSTAALVAVFLVPLVVKIKLIEIAPVFVLNGYGHWILDGFSWYKGITLFFAAALAAMGLILRRSPLTKSDALLFSLAALAVLSTIFSPYRHLNMMGVPYLLEGLPSSLAYIVLTMAAMRLPDKLVARLLPATLAASALIVSFLALSETGGKLWINEPWLASWLLTVGGETSPYGGYPWASFPFGNPNYLGMYAAMVWSFLLGQTITRKDLREGLLYATVTAVVFAVLLASLSRAGYIASGIAAIFGLGLLLFKERPRIIPILVLILAHGLAYQWTAQYTSNQTVSRIEAVTPEFRMTNFQRPEAPIVPTPEAIARFSKVFLEQGRLRIEGIGPLGPFVLLLQRQLHSVKFMDADYQPLAFRVGGPTEAEHEKVELMDPRYAGLKMALHDAGNFRILTMNGIDVAITNWGFRIGRVGAFVTPVAADRFPLPFPDSAFSFRGFIWAHSMPLLKNTLVLGHGAGSFPFEFPNNDPVKMSAIFGPDHLVDKPHNYFISFAHTHGVIALLIFFVMLGRMFWIKSRSLIRGDTAASDLPYMMGCIGYLITGIAVDSTIGVSTVFWVLLGVGLRMRKAPSREEIAP